MIYLALEVAATAIYCHAASLLILRSQCYWLPGCCVSVCTS